MGRSVSQGLGRCQRPWRMKPGKRLGAFLCEPPSRSGKHAGFREDLAVPLFPSKEPFEQPFSRESPGSTLLIIAEHLCMLALPL